MGTDAPITCPPLLEGLDLPYEADAPLGPMTWYGVGGAADLLVRPRDDRDLVHLVRRCHATGTPLRIFGSGANLLVADEGVDGVVARLDATAFRRIEIDPAGGAVRAGGGAALERLIVSTVREGLAGLEVLAGIPATIGGALRMNAGGAFGEICSVVRTVTVVEPDGGLAALGRDELGFAYRRSRLAGRIVLEAEFALTPASNRPALRQRLKQIMAYKKHSQPMAASSAGCAFKNPPPDLSEFGAGRLIDLAGLKGARIGGAEVSTRHANFIVLHDEATSSDVLALMRRVRRCVAERFGVELEREVVVWSRGREP